jgi:hypothetical protein
MAIHVYYGVSHKHNDSEYEFHLNWLYPDATGPFNSGILLTLHFSMLSATLHCANAILLCCYY